jgi:pimeloyl-ACP methyl ester carboxylesterase
MTSFRIACLPLVIAACSSASTAAEVPVQDRAKLRAMIAAHAEYIALPPDERAKRRPPSVDLPPLSKRDAARWRAALWDAWTEHVRETQDADLREFGDPLTSGRGAVRARLHETPGQTSTCTMRYFLRRFGKKPKSGWPLYINLHSGGNDKKTNDRCWALTRAQYPIRTGLYVCPRSVKDTAESWYEPNNYPLLTRLLAEAFARWGVDPDRVYLMGYSMGGWGVFHLGPSMPDAWAAVASSAGAGFVGPTGRAAPDNLRNTPMMIQIGTKDIAFRRYPLSRDFARALKALRKKDPEGYALKYKPHKGQGHRINDRDTPGWLARFRRSPLPDKVVWQQIVPTPGSSIAQVRALMARNFSYALHYRRRSYWLRNDDPGPFQRVVARRDRNTFHLEETRYVDRITFLLDDRMADLDRPVVVLAGGRELAKTTVRRTVDAIIRTLVPRGDPKLVFSAELTVQPPDLAARFETEKPSAAADWIDRARYRMARGRLAEAIADLEAALKAEPQRGPSQLFPLLLQLARRRRDAAAALRIYRNWADAQPESARVRAAFAAQLLRSSDEKQRDPAAALVQARKAAELTKHQDAGVLHLLALALAVNGQITQAVETEQKAIARLPRNAHPAIRAAYNAALKKYEAAATKGKGEGEREESGGERGAEQGADRRGGTGG